MGYLERISDWKACINAAFRDGCSGSALDALEKSNAKLFAETGDIGGDLEISFREVLAGFLESSCANNEVRSFPLCFVSSVYLTNGIVFR
jgi:hypothetical protein